MANEQSSQILWKCFIGANILIFIYHSTLVNKKENWYENGFV